METQHEVEQRQINTYLFGNYAAVSNSEVINLCSGKQPQGRLTQHKVSYMS